VFDDCVDVRIGEEGLGREKGTNSTEKRIFREKNTGKKRQTSFDGFESAVCCVDVLVLMS
jgi:hypothetical protein